MSVHSGIEALDRKACLGGVVGGYRLAVVVGEIKYEAAKVGLSTGGFREIGGRRYNCGGERGGVGTVRSCVVCLYEVGKRVKVTSPSNSSALHFCEVASEDTLVDGEGVVPQ